MARAPKNPNVDRVSRIPFDKDTVSPMPQITPRAPGRGDGARTRSPNAPAPDREEYPGPQTSSSGARAEPGRVRPTKPRER
jgi:hypothetical protein